MSAFLYHFAFAFEQCAHHRYLAQMQQIFIQHGFVRLTLFTQCMYASSHY